MPPRTPRLLPPTGGRSVCSGRPPRVSASGSWRSRPSKAMPCGYGSPIRRARSSPTKAGRRSRACPRAGRVGACPSRRSSLPSRPRNTACAGCPTGVRSLVVSRRAFLAILLLGVVLALPPIAHAAPTDPVWISGLYDDNDYDDVVLFILADVSALDSRVVDPVGPE